jgi:hypothetical protein
MNAPTPPTPARPSSRCLRAAPRASPARRARRRAIAPYAVAIAPARSAQPHGHNRRPVSRYKTLPSGKPSAGFQDPAAAWTDDGAEPVPTRPIRKPLVRQRALLSAFSGPRHSRRFFVVLCNVPLVRMIFDLLLASQDCSVQMLQVGMMRILLLKFEHPDPQLIDLQLPLRKSVFLPLHKFVILPPRGLLCLLVTFL